MRIRVLSDLHLEFGPFQPPRAEADVVVLAGDIAVGTKGVEWVASTFPDTPCVYVLGNHELYGGALPRDADRIAQRASQLGIHLLQDSEATIGGVRFLGATLWTDFDLLGDRQRALAVAASAMADFTRIRVQPRFRRLRPEDAWAMHDGTLRWLAPRLPLATPSVVVTHHAPSAASVAARHVADPLSPAFASRLDSLVAGSGASLWVHGHTHHSVDHRLGNTRVLSNQRGYPGESTGFDPALVATV